MSISRLIEVRDQSNVAEIRRAASAAAVSVGLDEHRAHDAGIIATELGTNLLKHAQGGSFIVQEVASGGVQMFTLDRGPGIAHVEKSMRDGHSTSGTPGNGLGAISRLATAMEIYSQPQHGTVVFASVEARTRDAAPPTAGRGGFLVASLGIPLAGETVSGDAISVQIGPTGCTVLVADGLGHGPFAAEAARGAVDVFVKHPQSGVMEMISRIHDALRSTRGAAVAAAHLQSHQGLVRYCGIGNIVGGISGGSAPRRMVSHNGTAGLGAAKTVEFSYPWTAGSVLIMHSDGIGSKWDLDQYPGLGTRHPALIAGVLLRDFSRGRDDAAVVVVREVSQ